MAIIERSNRFFLIIGMGLLLFVVTVVPVLAQSAGGAFEGIGDNDQPIQIEADKLEIIDKENTALLTGNVSVVQGKTIMKASRIKVFYLRSNQKGATKSGIRKIEASGKVAVRSDDNRVSADRATVDMVSENVLMTGNVIVSQGQNVLRGCNVTVNLRTNVSKITPCESTAGSGRVKILLTPKSTQ